jgi:hypothetical protein
MDPVMMTNMRRAELMRSAEVARQQARAELRRGARGPMRGSRWVKGALVALAWRPTPVDGASHQPA